MTSPSIRRRSVALLLAAAASVSAGCASNTDPNADVNGDPAVSGSDGNVTDVTVSAGAPVDATATSAEALSAPQVVYLNFDGPTINGCSGCSDAPTNRSLVINEYLGKSSVKFAPYTNASAKTAILQYLQQFYAKYRITFTAHRPTSGAYTMMVITPSYAPNHGISPLDCNNANRNDVGFVFRTGTYSAKFIAQEAAHELGHTFGLGHVADNANIMQWASSGDRFERASYDGAHDGGRCSSGGVQDEVAMLGRSLGFK